MAVYRAIGALTFLQSKLRDKVVASAVERSPDFGINSGDRRGSAQRSQAFPGSKVGSSQGAVFGWHVTSYCHFDPGLSQWIGD